MAGRPQFQKVARQPEEVEEVGELDAGTFFRKVGVGREIPEWKKGIRRSGDRLVTVKSRQYGREQKQYAVDTHKLDLLEGQCEMLDMLESTKKDNPSTRDIIGALSKLYGGRGRIPQARVQAAFNDRYKGNEWSRHTWKY